MYRQRPAIPGRRLGLTQTYNYPQTLILFTISNTHKSLHQPNQSNNNQMKSNTHQKVCAKCNPAATGDYTILHKIFQNLRQSFFLTHCVTLTENMRLVIQCKLNTVLLPRPPIEFVKHCIICEPAGSKGSRACDLCSAVDTTRFTSSVSRGVVSATGDGGDAAARGGTGLRPAPRGVPANRARRFLSIHEIR